MDSNMPKKFVDPLTTLTDYFDEIIVECPSCHHQGTVRNIGQKAEMFAPRRFTCLYCGKNKDIETKKVEPAEEHFQL